MTEIVKIVNENSPHELSAYEKLRINNIKRNNAKLRELGLISAFEEKQSNAIAEGVHVAGEGKENTKTGTNENENEKTPKKKKRKRNDGPVEGGSRKSLRLQGIGVDLKPVEEKRYNAEDIAKERIERVKECRETRLRAAKALALEGAEKAAEENPTATYEHCLMRVKTMSEKRLATRVKVIERAAGKHCVVKMAIFKSCLQDEGKWELAGLASEALERLKALKAPV
jgi:hypothetical protein